jgi:hypothetical protein
MAEMRTARRIELERIACVMFVVGLVGVGVACRDSGTDSGTRRASSRPALKQAWLDVRDYAFDAFTQWASMHPTKACPDKLEDLNEYMSAPDSRADKPTPRKDVSDPWGGRYTMYCGRSLPPGVKVGIGITSPGPDGKDGTADDIRSWDDVDWHAVDSAP